MPTVMQHQYSTCISAVHAHCWKI